MAHALFIQGKAGGLPHVVEEHGTAEDHVTRHGVQGVEGVLPHVVAVVAVPLAETHHGEELRPEDAENLRVSPQHRRRPFSRQKLKEFHLNPLRRDVPQPLPVPADSRRRPRLDFQPQRRRKPEAPENPQGVLLETAVRVPHAAENSPAQILPSAEGVPELAPEVPGHGVDREIPPGQVFPDGTGEGHGLRAAVVPVRAVHPVGGDLHRAAGRFHGDGAVLQPRRLRPGAEHRQGFLRPGGGGHVPVLRPPAREGVPDAAAHAPGLVARRFQRFQDRLYILRDIHRFCPLSPLHFFASYIIINKL